MTHNKSQRSSSARRHDTVDFFAQIGGIAHHLGALVENTRKAAFYQLAPLPYNSFQ
jgi:hypothetical protein